MSEGIKTITSVRGKVYVLRAAFTPYLLTNAVPHFAGFE